MQQLNSLRAASNAQELKERMQDIERITSVYTKLADQNFDDGQKLAKLKFIVPTNIYNFIAIAARCCGECGELVQMIEAQLMDPLTGITRCEKSPGLSSLGGAEDGNNWAKEQVETGLYVLGHEVNDDFDEMLPPTRNRRNKWNNNC